MPAAHLHANGSTPARFVTTPHKFAAKGECFSRMNVIVVRCKPAGNTTLFFQAPVNDASCRANTYCNTSTAVNPSSLTPAAAGVSCGSGGICDGLSATPTSCQSICGRFGASSCLCSSSSTVCQVCCQHTPTVIAGPCGTPFKGYTSNVSCVLFVVHITGQLFLRVSNHGSGECHESNLSVTAVLDQLLRTANPLQCYAT